VTMLSMAPSIFVALSVQIWITKLGPTSSMNFNSMAVYDFVFLFLIVSMESIKMSLVRHKSLTFITN
jgi:hypothetical protein